MELKELREEIDRIDDEMVRLFLRRMDIAGQIADYKKANGLPVFIPTREQEKLADVAEKAGPKMAEFIQGLYTTIFTLSREFQNIRIESSVSEEGFIPPEYRAKYGLLGQKLSHSYSPIIHGFLGNYSYSLFEREQDELEEFLKQGEFNGINVTIPYKKAVIPYLDELSPVAAKLGAVNTIIRKSDGTLLGHNTDYFGFHSLLQHTELNVTGKKVLVLGSGGASHTAVAVLKELGANVIVISRTGENNYENLSLHSDAAVIVNATPVGMYSFVEITAAGVLSHVERSPLALDIFPKLEGVLDLVYNPARTKLLRDAEARGILWENGLWMLVAQAKEAAEYFTGHIISDSVIMDIHQKLSKQMQNLILIGMPGCGKTTVGKILAEKTARNFLDSDMLIAAKTGKSIPEIFAADGVAAFRRLETDILRTAASQSGNVVSTGGGCVTEDRNYPLLHQNGIIIWLKRDLSLLSTEGRPLSNPDSLQQMYLLREPLYARFADYVVDNNGRPEETVAAILAILEELP